MPNSSPDTVNGTHAFKGLGMIWRPALEWLFWAALVAVAYAQTGNFDQEISVYEYGADGWPRAICFAILVGATCQLAWQISSLRHQEPNAGGGRDSTSDGAVPGSIWSIAQRAGFFLLPLLYLYLVARIGFYVTTPFFIMSMLALLEVRSVKAMIAVTAVIYGLALLVFTRLLYVALPVGRIDPFYDINNAIVVTVQTAF